MSNSTTEFSGYSHTADSLIWGGTLFPLHSHSFDIASSSMEHMHTSQHVAFTADDIQAMGEGSTGIEPGFSPISNRSPHKTSQPSPVISRSLPLLNLGRLFIFWPMNPFSLSRDLLLSALAVAPIDVTCYRTQKRLRSTFVH